ncbi:hypothetical protein BD310DRAFT_937357 [Dichomitus squalens]|uniref:Uncharacterized protein n=1 Tax=Dichomitus squalens TaxID=114155 RepID=A0A4Q9PGT5_9APHY|nr:hypothetical protein BD310DRAFT_937357 [Dichomitus squalens]
MPDVRRRWLRRMNWSEVPKCSAGSWSCRGCCRCEERAHHGARPWVAPWSDVDYGRLWARFPVEARNAPASMSRLRVPASDVGGDGARGLRRLRMRERRAAASRTTGAARKTAPAAVVDGWMRPGWCSCERSPFSIGSWGRKPMCRITVGAHTSAAHSSLPSAHHDGLPTLPGAPSQCARGRQLA